MARCASVGSTGVGLAGLLARLPEAAEATAEDCAELHLVRPAEAVAEPVVGLIAPADQRALDERLPELQRLRRSVPGLTPEAGTRINTAPRTKGRVL